LSGSAWEPNGSSEHHQKNQAEREGNANLDGVSCSSIPISLYFVYP